MIFKYDKIKVLPRLELSKFWSIISFIKFSAKFEKFFISFPDIIRLKLIHKTFDILSFFF